MEQFWQFLQSVGGKITIVASVLALTGILDKISKFKIWTWLFKWIGSKTNALLFKEVTAVKTGLEENTKSVKELKLGLAIISREVSENRYKSIKYEIVDFHNSLVNGKIVHKEQFNYMFDLITEYETDYKDAHNGELKNIILDINRRHQELLRGGITT